jgi:uncharacterized phage protein gp47/JayE
MPEDTVDGFYNLHGDYITEDTILDDLIEYYNTLHEAGKTKINDFEEGSEIRTLLGVFSHIAYNVLEEQNETLRNHFINSADGEYLDLIGANPNVNLERITGELATGFVKFTAPELAVGELTIPAGTICSTEDGVEFETDNDEYIAIGDQYTYVSVTAAIEGADGNVAAGTIVNSDLDGFTVTNENAFTNGADYEEDEDYRDRLLDFVREDNFGSIGYYENAMLNIENVHDIKIDSIATTSADVAYFINTNNHNNSREAFLAVITYFNDANNFVVGHDFEFSQSLLHQLSFTVTVNADCGYTEEDIQDFFKVYFKGGSMVNFPVAYQGLNMGEEQTSEGLISVLKDALHDISTATISSISNTYNSTTTSTLDFHPSLSSYEQYCAYSLGTVTVVFENEDN